jgi:hypothetical protein
VRGYIARPLEGFPASYEFVGLAEASLTVLTSQNLGAMADPFEVRMRFTSQLQHLNASVNSAQKAAQYALKYRDMDEDLHSCILEQLERVRKIHHRLPLLLTDDCLEHYEHKGEYYVLHRAFSGVSQQRWPR